jgi:hypothetical protein
VRRTPPDGGMVASVVAARRRILVRRSTTSFVEPSSVEVRAKMPHWAQCSNVVKLERQSLFEVFQDSVCTTSFNVDSNNFTYVI